MSGTRRTAAEWARPAHPVAPAVDVLIPTAGRTAELAVTLAGLAAQDRPSFRVVLSDQSADGAMATVPAVAAMVRVLRAQGREVTVLRHASQHGMAEHRQFLFDHSEADAVLFLDDDVWLEPGALGILHDALETLGCGFVGMAVQGLSYLDDVRPHEQQPFELWGGRVEPERIRSDVPAYERHRLHNAANITHLAGQAALRDGEWTAYKVAWIGGCTMFRRSSLEAAGAFSFWPDLPRHHSGEDVRAQWHVMERDGGAGILPSGAVHLEAPTTIPRRDLDAFDPALIGSSGGGR